jgi:DNA-binding NarL/FixJ family response regulator
MAAPTVGPELRVFLVEDHPAVREGLSLLLGQHGMVPCGTADGLRSAEEGIAASDPAVVILDLALGGEDGLALLEWMRAQGRSVPVLVYSIFEDAPHIAAALSAGAAGYVTKQADPGHLVAAVRAVARRRRYLDPVAASAVGWTEDHPEGGLT